MRSCILVAPEQHRSPEVQEDPMFAKKKIQKSETEKLDLATAALLGSTAKLLAGAR